MLLARVTDKLVRTLAAAAQDAGAKLVHESIARDTIEHAIAYLRAYGYLPQDIGNLSVAEIAKAVRKFERFLGLATTGKISPQLVSVMSRPRCGCMDIQALGTDAKAANRNPWAAYGIAVVRWGFDQFLDFTSKNQQIDMIQAAADHWAAQTGLKHEYVQDTSKAHVRIGRAEKGMRDGSDGRGNMLAYTFLPSQVKPPIPMLFDVAESWSDHASAFQIWYQQTAEHELGHVFMNLEHSSPSDGIRSLMDPIYDPAVPTIQPQDIARGQAVWGPPAPAAPVPTPPGGATPFPPGQTPGDRYRIVPANGGEIVISGLGALSLERA